MPHLTVSHGQSLSPLDSAICMKAARVNCVENAFWLLFRVLTTAESG